MLANEKACALKFCVYMLQFSFFFFLFINQSLRCQRSQGCQKAFELGRRFFSETKEVYIRNPNDVFNYLRDMGNLNKEHFRGLYLDVNKNGFTSLKGEGLV
jgi:hypothetical protein